MKSWNLGLLITVALFPAAASAALVPYLRWDAAQDTTANNLWESTSSSSEVRNWTLNAPAAPIDVSSSTSTTLTQAYVFGGAGITSADGGNFQTISGNPTNESVTFELWFKPFSLTAGEQILIEAGGTIDGLSITLDDNLLRFRVKDGNSSLTASASLSAIDDFLQVVGVYRRNDPGTTDTASLFVNGGLQQAPTTSGVNDWAGSNPAGLGSRANDVGGSISGDLNAFGTFNGQIALVNMYRQALSNRDVALAYRQTADGIALVSEPGIALLLGIGLVGLLGHRFLRPS